MLVSIEKKRITSIFGLINSNTNKKKNFFISIYLKNE